jgi:medium-chain acyl-[acyl-carrier-protein] hydrolase
LSAADQGIVRIRPNPRARVRLICFPHAGGGSTAFRGWAGPLGEDVEVCAVVPPGRERRIAERPLSSIDAMVRSLGPVLAPWLDVPVVFFGHSMGALLAYETVDWLRAAGHGNLPVLLVVSGRRPPDRPGNRPPTHHLPAEEFLADLLELGGTPRELTEHPDLLDMLLPMLRADVQAVETYRHRARPPLDTPIVAFGGTDDDRVPVPELAGWQRHTTAECRVRIFPGGHFFVYDDAAEAVGALRAELRPLLVG